ncbi:MAG: methyl-accepting chemotaxis protein [Propionivibrio sp.]
MPSNMTIKFRLLILGSIAILGICISGGMGLHRLALIETQLEDTLKNTRYGIHLMINVSQANIHFKTQVQEWKNILIRGDAPDAFAQYRKSYQESERQTQQELQTSLKEMKESGHPRVAEIEAVIKLHSELSALYSRQIGVWDVNDPNNTQRADRALRGLDRPATEAMNALVEGMEKDERSRIENQLEAARALYIETRNAFVIILLVAVSIVGALIFTTTRSINRKIASLQAAIVNIRQRLDLSLRLPAEGADEISMTARSVNDLLGEFQSVVSRMKDSAAHVSTASEGLATSVAQLSDSVSQQNESTAAMAASVEELAVSVTHISDSSNAAQQISKTSREHAQNGGEVIGKTVTGMVDMTKSLQATAMQVETLGQRSQEIGSIAGVIKEIADQTNLLALNAAIEAARAGEQGRGFAVVADEVRKLAERTGDATTEIANVISAIQTDTQKAVHEMSVVVELANSNAEIARQAGGSIDDIQNGAAEVFNATNDIATALNEQSAANDLIAQQVEVIATMSEKNTVALGGVHQASAEMKQLSDEMHATVDRFKV